MNTREMLRLSWRAWVHQGSPRVGPWWIGHAWTVVFSLGVALGFSVLFWPRHGVPPSALGWYGANAVVSLTIGFAVRFAFWASRRLLGNERIAGFTAWQRWLYFSAVPLAGVAIGWPLAMRWAMDVDVRNFFPADKPALLLGSILVVLLITAAFQMFFWTKSRQIQAEDRASEAQLRLLQAQIEPHFLFNTLANVSSLMEVDVVRARTMLEAFVDYLRASLSGLGHGRHTLGDEVDLVEAYMRIIKIRMEDRLDYRVDVPVALRALPLPPLTLQPLVENAIVHGLEPQIAGGRVRIDATSDGRRLVVTVADDGAGLPAADARRAGGLRAGSGTALANIRQRLAQTHGLDASLAIEAVAPHGVRACLSLPLTAR